MYNKSIERTPCKCFRYGSEDPLIAKCTKPPKDNKKWRKQVRLSERCNCSSQKEYDSGENNNDQNIYSSMASMSDNDECPSRDFGESL